MLIAAVPRRRRRHPVSSMTIEHEPLRFAERMPSHRVRT